GMDNSMLNIFQYSFSPTDVPKWKMEQFPDMKYEEYEYLKRNVDGIDRISFNYFTNTQNIKSEYATANDVSISPCSFDYQYIDNVKVEKGRFFSESEDASGSPVVVLGYEIAEVLFPNVNPIGQTVR